MDRIDATLRNFNTYKPLSILDYSDNYDVWVVIPSLTFTCPGIITSLTYGAQQGINDKSSITLHILRINNETQRYNIVNNITIMAEQTGSQLYQLHLSPPLAFQHGDIIGYQSIGQMRFIFENVWPWSSHTLHYSYVGYNYQYTVNIYHAILSISTGMKLCVQIIILL